LFECVESVKEALPGYNRALSDEGRAVSVVGSSLEYTVPVLQTINVCYCESREAQESLTIVVTKSRLEFDN
jgi:hypothetical protein